MKLGIRLPHKKGGQVGKLAIAADNAGFDSLWALERLLWPMSPQTRFPGNPNRNFPEDWQIVFEFLELLSFVAAITKRIDLGKVNYNFLLAEIPRLVTVNKMNRV